MPDYGIGNVAHQGSSHSSEASASQDNQSGPYLFCPGKCLRGRAADPEVGPSDHSAGGLEPSHQLVEPRSPPTFELLPRGSVEAQGFVEDLGGKTRTWTTCNSGPVLAARSAAVRAASAASSEPSVARSVFVPSRSLVGIKCHFPSAMVDKAIFSVLRIARASSR